MKINILTIFPEIIQEYSNHSIIKKSLDKKLWDLKITNIRDYSTDKFNRVDDKPYGLEQGMLIRPDVLGNCIDNTCKNSKIIYMSPKGSLLNQEKIRELLNHNDLSIICGRYEGIDERVIEEYNIPVRKAATACIKAEDDTHKSITYKTFHLLNALKLDGVLPALTNIIIRQFMNKMEASGAKEVNMDDFKTYIVAIRDDYQHNADNCEYRDIHELAFKLWKAALLCKDYEIPRELAKKGMQNISMKNWNPAGLMIDVTTQSKMIQQFREWIQNWQYGKSATADLKVKVLFINLFKTKLNDAGTELTFDKAIYSFVTDKLQLDHMEAQNPSESNMAKHFTPVDPHEMREKYIDSLGNMMILDSDNNNDKDNKPLAEAMVYYENMCMGHWLNSLTMSLLKHYHVDVPIAGSVFMVPTEQFFNERGSRLRQYFEKIIVRDFDSKKIIL